MRMRRLSMMTGTCCVYMSYNPPKHTALAEFICIYYKSRHRVMNCLCLITTLQPSRFHNCTKPHCDQ